MTNDIAGISIANSIMGLSDGMPEPAAVRRRTKELQYWRLHTCPRSCVNHTTRKNWVTTGPVLSPYTAVEYTDFMETKHAQPLSRDFGTDSGRNSIVPGSGMMHDAATRFVPLIRNNGIDEFPADQLVAYGWHRIPNIRQARPDLQEYLDNDIYCEYGCPERVFGSEKAYAKHVTALHSEAAGARAVGKQLEKVVAANVSGGINTTELGIAIANAIMQFEANKGQPLQIVEPLPGINNEDDEEE